MIKIDWGIQSSLLSKSLNKIAHKKKKHGNFSISEDSSSDIPEENTNATKTTSTDAYNSLISVNKTNSKLQILNKKDIQKKIEIGEDLLGHLQSIQENLLLDSLSEDDLKKASKLLNTLPEIQLNNGSNPLLYILNDIKVRIAVELEKYSK